MNAVTASGMRSIEEAAMKAGWTEDQLMELAGERLAGSFCRRFPCPGTVIAYLGKGHNAGDAFVALRHLRDRHGWDIAIRPAFPMEKWAPLTRVKSYELGAVENHPDTPPWRDLKRPLVLLDGLLGIGAEGPPRAPVSDMAGEMNLLRETAGAVTAAIDQPSGTDPDTGIIHPGSVIADITFMIAAPKRGLLLEQAADATGALAVVSVDALPPPQGQAALRMTSPESIRGAHQPRPFSFHKGRAGRIGILAGSSAYSGAAVLAATGALRGGGGLVTLHVPPDAVPLVIPRCPLEVIVRPCEDPLELLDLRYDSLVIGCGLHSDDLIFRRRILELIASTDLPAVIDAEALNQLAESGDLSVLKQNHVLTPHPGEFARLTPRDPHLSREDAAGTFARRYPSTLLLKGSRTLIIRGDEAAWANPTGTPGMATGGQGDLLGGVIGALLAIGNSAPEAAAMAAWLCGRAAERAVAESHLSPEAVLPADVLHHLGGAFRDWAERHR